MKCLHCGDNLRWNNDFDTEDDDQYNIVSMYECMNEHCKAWYEIYHGLKEKKGTANEKSNVGSPREEIRG